MGKEQGNPNRLSARQELPLLTLPSAHESRGEGGGTPLDAKAAQTYVPESSSKSYYSLKWWPPTLHGHSTSEKEKKEEEVESKQSFLSVEAYPEKGVVSKGI